MSKIIKRHHKFDAGHQLLHIAGFSPCKNTHGHEYKILAKFSYDVDTTGDHLGYAIDFGEIKRIYFGFIDHFLDHGFIANPQDELLQYLIAKDKKYWVMSLGNPTAENIAAELFYIGEKLMASRGLTMHNIELHETTNCAVDISFITDKERDYLSKNIIINQKIAMWDEAVGNLEYDARKAVSREVKEDTNVVKDNESTTVFDNATEETEDE